MERISQRFWAGGGIAAPLAAEQGVAVTPRPRYGPLCTVYSRIASQSSAQPQRRLRIPAEAARTRSFSTDAVVGRCRFSATLFRSILDPLGRPTFFFPPFFFLFRFVSFDLPPFFWIFDRGIMGWFSMVIGWILRSWNILDFLFSFQSRRQREMNGVYLRNSLQ